MKIFLFFLTCTLLLVSCRVVESDEPANSVNTDEGIITSFSIIATDDNSLKTLITGDSIRTWNAQAFTLAGQTTFTSCRLDDGMIFMSNGTYQYEGGSTLCGSEDNLRTKRGTWVSNFENKTIVFDQGSSNEIVTTIIGLSENLMSLRSSYRGMEVRGRYQHQ